MPLSQTPGSYQDVADVLNTALRHAADGPIEYELPTPNAATRWAHRAYYFRKLLLKQKLKELEQFPGIVPTTPYDLMVLRVRGKVVNIEFTRPTGVIKVDGKKVEIETTKGPDDDLLEEARQFAETLGMEEEPLL